MALIDVFSSRPAAVLILSGEDHLEFLQSQGTADLRGPSGLCRYTLWLDHKGRIHGDSFVLKMNADQVALVSYETPAERLMEKFRKHIIADDVELADHTSQWRLLSLPPGSTDGLLEGRARNLEPDRFFIEADGYVFAGRRLGKGSVEYLVPEETSLPLDLTKLSIESAEAIRIAAGVPVVPRDTDAGGLNPIESGLLSAVSFDKGCYLGQEVVARVHRLKRVSRRIVRVAPPAAGTARPEVPADLVMEGSVVGGLTSVAENPDNWQALGWLKSKVADGDHEFDAGRFRIQSLPES